MWQSNVEILDSGRVRKLTLLRDAHPLRYSNVIKGWQSDGAFRAFFISLLADAPFPAYFWETPPITEATLDRHFEFVLVDSPQLATVRADPSAFESYFRSAHRDDWIVTFANLGNDAFLVVPCPRAGPSAYAHIAAFAREAPEFQQHALWRGVGAVLEQRLHAQPIWLSTAGLGVYWLHVRLDSYPKYYSFRPYSDVV